MKKSLIFTTAGLLLLFLIPSCYYDNKEDLYAFEIIPCDTTNITYSHSIAAIMAANCNTCHSGINPQKNVITDNYNDLNVIVKNGQLWKSVDHVEGVIPMPYQGNKLSDCNVKMIDKWIKAGALNN